MKNIKNGIDNYIKSNSQYALLLDGEWGSGKTYFIKHDIMNDLQKKSDYCPIYVSLYGLTNMMDVRKRINLAILSSSGIRKKLSRNNESVTSFKNKSLAIENIGANFLPIRGLTYGIEELVSFVD